jgi:archaellum component FlaF (FlaF/FlaG flagellin family)
VCFGQSKKVENIDVTTSKVVFLGKTSPVSELIKKDITSPEKKAKFKKDKKKPQNFQNRLGQSKVVIPELEHQGIDPVWQSTHGKKLIQRSFEPDVNIEGLGIGSPTDPTGSVGLDYYIQAVNATAVGVWDKEGNMVTQFAMNTIWSQIGENSAGDPIIIYDQEESRWILTEFTGPANLLIAVSETSDPLGSYYAYSFSTPNFPDYPKYGLWSNHLVVTSNEQGAGALHQYFIERDSLLIGADARMQRVEIFGTTGSEQGFVVSTPVDWEGQTRPEDSRPIVMKLNDSSWGEVANDAIELFRFDIDYEDENNTQVESLLINTAPYDGFPCFPGPGFACCPQPNGDPLDALPEVIMNAPQYRNFGTHEAVVLSFVTDVTDGENHAGVRWIELRRTAGNDWSLYQEGSYAPDANHRYMSGIAIDKNGNIALAYNISSDSVFVGIRYTGRFEGDSLGQMTLPEVTVIDGNSTLNTNGRFADYSHISVDPDNENTFWFTSEYARAGVSRTRIASWSLEQDSFDMAVLDIIEPESSFDLTAAETVEVEVTNFGSEEAEAYSLILSQNGVDIETLEITDPLRSLDFRRHTFDGTIDMSEIGDYDLNVRVEYEPETNFNNNEASKLVQQFAAFETVLELNGSNFSCDTTTIVELTITNNGGVALTDAEVEVSLGGTVVDTYIWTGNLAINESETVEYLFPEVAMGDALYTFNLIVPGTTEFIPENNMSDILIRNVGIGGFASLDLFFDNFPNETSWTITEQGSPTILFEGSDYGDEFEATLLNVDLCLDPDLCYTFTMLDTYGDGICCGFGMGNVSMVNASGQTIFNNTGEFGNLLLINFCPAEIQCNITADIDVTDAVDDGSLGTILITPSGGVAPFSYSIDGGVTVQESNVFENLPNGEYTVTIFSAGLQCQETFTVTIDLLSDVNDVLVDQIVFQATPNPNKGFFDLTVENYNGEEHFMHFDIINANGKLVQSRRMANYSGVYKTQVSLLEYPDGTYFIRFKNRDINKMIKVIKL